MAKVHSRIRKNFTIAPNELINDESLSPVARFLFVYIASKPDEWEFLQSSTCKKLRIKDARTLRKYLRELESAGWLTIGEQVNKDGEFGAKEYGLNPYPIPLKYRSTKNVPRPTYNFCDTQNLRHAKNVPHSNTDFTIKQTLEKDGRTNGQKENLEIIENSEQTARRLKFNPLENFVEYSDAYLESVPRVNALLIEFEKFGLKSPDAIFNFMERFGLAQITQNHNGWSNPKDFAKHFRSWLKIQLRESAKPQPSGRGKTPTISEVKASGKYTEGDDPYNQNL